VRQFKEQEKKMKKRIALFVLLAAVTAVTAFAQPYKDEDGYKYWTTLEKDGYRILRIQTKTNYYIDHLGVIDLVKASVAGDPRVVEIVSVFSKGDTNYHENERKWAVGEKTTIEAIMKDPSNVGTYKVNTGSGYFVEFATWSEKNWLSKVSNRKFGVILPNSSVEISSHTLMKILYGAVGWDDDFQAASNLDEYMEYLAKKVDYNWLKKMVDQLKNDFANNKKKGSCPRDIACLCGGDINLHITLNATVGAAGWGALWGLAPPLLIPAEFAKVMAQYTAQAYLAAAIGYCAGRFPKGGDAFTKQLKIDCYLLFSGMDENSYGFDSTKGMGESAMTETILKASEKIMTKIAPKGLSMVPVVGTVWGVGKGAYDGAKDAVQMGIRATKYYNNLPDFDFEPTTGTITKYNGKNNNINFPAKIKNPGMVREETVRIIGKEVFKNNTAIVSVTLDNNTIKIEDEAFMGCKSLKTVTLKAPEMAIGKNAFDGCTSLTSVDIPQGARKLTVGADAFKGTKLDEYSKMKLRALGYTGAGVGEAIPSYTVTFMMPTGAPIYKSVVKNDTAPIPTNPTKADAVFVEWNTKSDGSGTVFTKSTKVTDNITLYPVWKDPSYTVIFQVPNGAPIQRSAVKNNTVDFPKDPTKDGYTFEGWNTKSDGKGTDFTKSTKVTGSITLYPKWKAAPASAQKTETKPAAVNYTVTFHRNGGTSAEIPKVTAAANSKVTLPKSPTRPNYTFTGWNTKADGSGDSFTANTVVKANIEVYAQWKK
jgi:uncharacterized repeat protein (TIGR02543 family)